MAKILMIEDDLEVCATVEDWLTSQFHTVETTGDGLSGLERARYCQFDLIILDLNLPDLEGLELLRLYRADGGKAPVLIISGRKEVLDKESGLDGGADDYLIKPFHTKELSARVRALLRRPPLPAQSFLRLGPLELDTLSCRLLRGTEEIHLQPKEYALLEFFMRHPNQVFNSDAIMDRVWPSDTETSADALRVHITKLRSKIDQEGRPSFIRTLRGIGYKLEPPA